MRSICHKSTARGRFMKMCGRFMKKCGRFAAVDLWKNAVDLWNVRSIYEKMRSVEKNIFFRIFFGRNEEIIMNNRIKTNLTHKKLWFCAFCEILACGRFMKKCGRFMKNAVDLWKMRSVRKNSIFWCCKVKNGNILVQ